MRKVEKATRLAKTLEYERLKKGMTHEEFSNFLGIPRSSVTTYLLARSLPGANRLKIISKKLNLDIAKILLN